MVVTDTSPAAADAQRAAWRRMSGTQRMVLAMEMSDDVLAIALAGVAARHPHLSPVEQRLALVRVMHGIDVPVPRPR